MVVMVIAFSKAESPRFLLHINNRKVFQLNIETMKLFIMAIRNIEAIPNRMRKIKKRTNEKSEN
jgi:hypothetical protein